MIPFDPQFDVPLTGPFYNDSHRAWQETLRRFITKEITPYADEWDEVGDVPRELHKKCADIGITRLGYPEEYGGVSEGMDIFHSILRTMELGHMGAGGITCALTTHGIGLPPLIATGSKELKERVAPDVISGEKIMALAITEPGAGSDVANISTKAVRDGNHYIVNGSKTFISGGMHADYYTVAVRTGGAGAGGVSLLLLEKDMPGFTQTRLKKQGWWASDTATLYFDDVRVPAENLIGLENKGFQGIMTNFNGERLALTANAIGAARACLQDAVNWARERKTFGKRLADHQVIRHKIAEMYRKITASQAMLDRVAANHQAGVASIADLSLLKVQSTLTMEFCAREASQILGGASFIRGNRVERIYREVRVYAIGGGSEEIMRDLASRQLGI